MIEERDDLARRGVFTRRGLLRSIAATTTAALLAPPAEAASRPFFDRKRLPIGLQLYTLGGEASADIDATFANVAKIGYREVELPNLLGRKPSELGAAAKRAGLSITSLHLPLLAAGGPGLSLASDPSEIADALGALQARWVVSPILLLEHIRPGKGEALPDAISRTIVSQGADVWKRSADLLNTRAAALKSLGIRVGYHNHNLEFARIGGETGWDILTRETEPGLVSFEVDIGWVAAAGLDPVDFLDRNRGRVALLHVKDLTAATVPNFAIAMQPTEVGSGRLDWARILPAAYRAGARHFFVEQEPPFAIPRMEAAARSYSFLSRLRA